MKKLEFEKMWSMDKRIQTGQKIEREAHRTAKRLGATAVMIVASYVEADRECHVLTGGRIPGFSPIEVYNTLAKGLGATALANGGDAMWDHDDNSLTARIMTARGE